MIMGSSLFYNVTKLSSNTLGLRLKSSKFFSSSVYRRLWLYSKRTEKCRLINCLKSNHSFDIRLGKHDLATSIKNENADVTGTKGTFFIENESLHHHKALENSSLYASTIYKSDPNFPLKYSLKEDEYSDILSVANWESKSSNDVVRSFVSLGVYLSEANDKLTVDDHKFNRLVTEFVNKASTFNDDQVMDCLIGIQYWPLSEHVKAENYLKVWKALDDVCLERLSDWSIDKILYFIDLWYKIRLARLSKFVFKGILKISNKCENLTQAQMIQTLFYMSCTRKVHPAVSFRDYEYFIQKHITHLSIEEIGIFALAFFKTKTAILNTKILMYVMQRVIEEINEIHQFTLTAIVKEIRLSHKPEIGFTADDFVNKVIEKKMDSLNLLNAIHILHISTQMQFYNEDAITKLAEKFCSDPSAARLKDMERVAFVLSLFDYIPPSTPNIVEIISEELNKPQHVQSAAQFPLIILSLVYYLSLLRTYPEKHIRQLLDETHLKKTYDSKYIIPHQVLSIEYNRVLEGPPESKYLLPSSLREYLGRRYSIFIPDKSRPLRSQFEHMFMEVMELTKEILGGDDYVLASYPLPHYPRADILFHLDEAGKPVAIPEEMRTRPQWEDVLRTPDAKGWYAVLLGGRNMYMHNTPRLVGEQSTKLRQLRALGYTPITIPFHYWKGEKNKLEYLNLKYFTRPE